MNNVIAIAIGGSNSLALKADGSVVSWGTNNFGTLPPPPAGLSNIVAIAGGYMNNMALQSDGTLYSWRMGGSLSVAQTGIVASSLNTIGSPFTYSLALRPDGTVAAWGDNSAHQCNVPADLTNAVSVIGGSGYGMALRADGTIVAWGDAAPAAVSNLTDVVAISGGGSIGLALKKDGTVAAWGTYWNGSANVPMTVPDGLTNVVAISAGPSHALALVGDAPPLTQAAASNAKWSTNCLSLSVPTENGRVYRLEYKNSMSDTNWQALPMAPGVGAMKALRDVTATNSTRIYRVKRW
jgi:alpha-tubulin suppressor-like RCC1 family protein